MTMKSAISLARVRASLSRAASSASASGRDDFVRSTTSKDGMGKRVARARREGRAIFDVVSEGALAAVQIDDRHGTPHAHERNRDVHRGGGLAGAALFVAENDDMGTAPACARARPLGFPISIPRLLPRSRRLLRIACCHCILSEKPQPSSKVNSAALPPAAALFSVKVRSNAKARKVMGAARLWSGAGEALAAEGLAPRPLPRSGLRLT